MEAKRCRHQPDDIEKTEGREHNWPNRAPHKFSRRVCTQPMSPISAEPCAAPTSMAVTPLSVRREQWQLLQSLEDWVVSIERRHIVLSFNDVSPLASVSARRRANRARARLTRWRMASGFTPQTSAASACRSPSTDTSSNASR